MCRTSSLHLVFPLSWFARASGEARKHDRASALMRRPRGAPAFRRNAIRRVSENQPSDFVGWVRAM